MIAPRKTSSKRFWISVVLGGLFVYALVGGLAFWALYQQTSERAFDTVEYVKKQSLECELVNDANVMKSQVRVVQNASQAARDIEADSGDLSGENLRRYASDLHLTGVYVLDRDGRLIAGHEGGGESFERLRDHVPEEEILDVAEHPEKVYGTRLYLEDGSYADFACTGRLDAPGIVAVVYHTETGYANRFLLTLQSLLDSYRIAADTSVVVERDGAIVASNTASQGDDDASSSDQSIVDEIRQTTQAGQMHLVKGESAYYYGIYGTTRDYTVFTFTKASRLLHYVASSALAALVAYSLLAMAFVTVRRRSDRKHLESMLDQERRYASQLEEAVKTAERANAAKTDFLQRMSHDLRTPLNGIRGMVEVGNAHADDARKQAECRKKVWNASGVLLDLVNEALDMSKLESGKIALEAEAVDLDKVIDDVCDMVERQASERKVGISRTRIGVVHPYVKSSALYLRRLLMNIANNAVKYNKFGGEVSIAHRELSCEGGVATHEVTVSDTGIGMSEQFQERLFEPFAREEQELDYKPSGTGLGMSISKQLVELMGGTISCESELGRGTTCTIVIPFEVADESEVVASASTSGNPASLEGVNILLAEDNELNREIAEFVITSADGTVCIAENGAEAVDLFRSSAPGTFDAILMDIMMPVLDGYAAARAIRDLEREDAKLIPIIAVSANAFADDRRKSFEAGMNAHVAKPLDAGELVATIESLVRA